MDKVPDDVRAMVIRKTLYREPIDEGVSSPPSDSDVVKESSTDGSQGKSLGGLLQETLGARADKTKAREQESEDKKRAIREAVDADQVTDLMAMMMKR